MNSDLISNLFKWPALTDEGFIEMLAISFQVTFLTISLLGGLSDKKEKIYWDIYPEKYLINTFWNFNKISWISYSFLFLEFIPVLFIKDTKWAMGLFFSFFIISTATILILNFKFTAVFFNRKSLLDKARDELDRKVKKLEETTTEEDGKEKNWLGIPEEGWIQYKLSVIHSHTMEALENRNRIPIRENLKLLFDYSITPNNHVNKLFENMLLNLLRDMAEKDPVITGQCVVDVYCWLNDIKDKNDRERIRNTLDKRFLFEQDGKVWDYLTPGMQEPIISDDWDEVKKLVNKIKDCDQYDTRSEYDKKLAIKSQRIIAVWSKTRENRKQLLEWLELVCSTMNDMNLGCADEKILHELDRVVCVVLNDLRDSIINKDKQLCKDYSEHLFNMLEKGKKEGYIFWDETTNYCMIDGPDYYDKYIERMEGLFKEIANGHTRDLEFIIDCMDERIQSEFYLFIINSDEVSDILWSVFGERVSDFAIKKIPSLMKDKDDVDYMIIRCATVFSRQEEYGTSLSRKLLLEMYKETTLKEENYLNELYTEFFRAEGKHRYTCIKRMLSFDGKYVIWDCEGDEEVQKKNEERVKKDATGVLDKVREQIKDRELYHKDREDEIRELKEIACVLLLNPEFNLFNEGCGETVKAMIRGDEAFREIYTVERGGLEYVLYKEAQYNAYIFENEELVYEDEALKRVIDVYNLYEKDSLELAGVRTDEG